MAPIDTKDTDITDVVYFITNPGRVIFMSPYVKLKSEKFPIEASRAGLKAKGLELVIPDGSDREHIEKEVERWEECVSSSLVGVKRAVYWSVNEVRERTDGDSAYRVMNAIKRAVERYVIPYSHNDVLSVVRSNTEDEIEETLQAIGCTNIKPIVFEPLEKEGVAVIAKDCLEYLLSKKK